MYVNDDLTPTRRKKECELKKDTGVNKVTTIDGIILCAQYVNGKEVKTFINGSPEAACMGRD